MASITVTLSVEEQALLDQLSQDRHRGKSEIATDALRGYLRFEAEQIRKIKEGIAAADSGDFATDEEVEAFFADHADPQ
jgi:predicted transcriptional regulator